MNMDEIVILKNGTAIMEHLSGEEVEQIKSEGLYLFMGEMGRMEPIRKLTSGQADNLIKEIGIKQVIA